MVYAKYYMCALIYVPLGKGQNGRMMYHGKMVMVWVDKTDLIVKLDSDARFSDTNKLIYMWSMLRNNARPHGSCI